MGTTCNMAKSLPVIGLLFVAALALAAPTPTKSIVQLAAGIPDLSTLVTALKAGDLVTALEGAGPFTVFAPTNEAFAALPPATLASLLEPKNLKELQSILEYHVISGAAVRAEDLKPSQNVKTLEGQELHINKISGSVTVQNAKVIQADVGATNGVVHVINGVLTPPTTFDSAVQTRPSSLPDIVQLASNDPALSTFVTALKAAQLTAFIGGGGPFTVFAPTNKAFSLLPAATLAHLLDPANIKELQDVLKFHVLPIALQSKDLKAESGGDGELTYEGSKLFFNSFKKFPGKLFIDYLGGPGNAVVAIFVDLEASNGVLHVIDQVLVPPANTHPKSICDVAAANPELSTLRSLLKAAEVNSPGESGFWKFLCEAPKYPRTLFAPSNEAFARLPCRIPPGSPGNECTVGHLLDPANFEELAALLEYHIHNGVMFSKELAQDGDPQDGASNLVSTIRPDQAPVQVSTYTKKGDLISNAKILINNAVVTTADIRASFGVVHIIDTVLTVPKPSIATVISANPDLATFVTALKAEGKEGGQLFDSLKVHIENGDCPLGCGFTVFAPTNEAFAKLPAKTLADLLDPANFDALALVLTYHIANGPVASKHLTDSTIYTFNGENLSASIHMDRIFMQSNDASSKFFALVTVPDVQARNGVIHIVDTVMIPNDLTPQKAKAKVTAI